MGDFVRLAWEIQNNLDLSSDNISERIHKIGAGYTANEVGDQLWDTDCYNGGRQNSVICCADTRNTSQHNADRHLITSSGTVFGKSPLRIPLNIYYHSHKGANFLLETGFSFTDSEICCSYRLALIQCLVIKPQQRRRMPIARQDFSVQ